MSFKCVDSEVELKAGCSSKMMWIIGGGEPAFVIVFVAFAFRYSIWILETSVDTTNVNKNTDANGSNFDLSKVGAINDKANTQRVSNKGVLTAVR
jgi:hypothetical protein